MTARLVQEVLSALGTEKNVLLYGPPGTGKTWLVAQVIAHLQARKPSGGRPTLNVGSVAEQFGTAAGAEIDKIPEAMRIEWVTFHQSYSYEEFILGRRPVPHEGGITLEPHFGILMTIAVQLGAETNSGCLLIIDELNRANTGQVFGEFITLLDGTYRSTVGNVANPQALPIRFPGVSYGEGLSEPIRMLRGGATHQLPEDWTFPEHIYVLATMNSVDKAALPLDSALTRRFHRVEMRPSPELLADNLQVSYSALETKSHAIRAGNQDISSLGAEETAVLIMDRLNAHISADMGEDFALGHSLFWNIGTASVESRWSALARAWDHAVLPQILERYAGRSDALIELLKADPGSPTQVAFHERRLIGSDAPVAGTLTCVPLLSLSEATAKEVLQNLAI